MALAMVLLAVLSFERSLTIERAHAAATITVTTTNQEVDTDADCSLQEAIFAANYDASKAIDPANLNGPRITTGCTAGSGTDTIVLQAGAVYQVSGIVQDQFSVPGLVANPHVFTPIIIEGNGATLELIGGLKLRAFTVSSGSVELDGGPATLVGTGNLTIRNLHIRNFAVVGGNGAEGGGGGLGAGGAIYVNGGAGSLGPVVGTPTLIVENSTFSNNSATGGAGSAQTGIAGGGGGGGLGGNGATSEGSGNGGGGGGGSRGNGANGASSGGGGGGTANDGVVGGVTVGGNGGFNCGGKGGDFNPQAVTGANGFCAGGGGGGGAQGNPGDGGAGGVGNYGGGGGGGGAASITDPGDGGDGGFGGGGGSAGTGPGAGGNGGFGGGGGGNGGSLAAGTGGLFGGNANGGGGGGGAGLGGAIFNDSGIVSILNSTFTTNTAAAGVGAGGGANGNLAGGAVFSRNGTLSAYNSTFSGNIAGSNGGAIYILGDGAQANAFVRNTIMANNGADEGETAFAAGGSVAAGGSGNLIMQNAVAGPIPGVVSSTNPNLGPLQINAPGNTPTMAITSTSSAYNAGDNGNCLATDQRGIVRPQGAACDIGAYELELADVSITKTADSPEVIAGKALFYTITVHNFGPGTANSVVVTDVLPAGVTYIADTANTVPPGGCTPVVVALVTTLTCNLAPIPNGGTAVFKIKVLVPADFVQLEADGTRTLINTATVTSIGDTNPANNTSTVGVFVTEQADLIITKYVEPIDTAVAGPNTLGGGAISGATLVYTILIDNLGPSAARNVIFFDTLLNSGLVSVQSCAFSVSQGGGAITQFTCTTGPVVSTQFGTGMGAMATNFLAPFGEDLVNPGVNPTGRLRASFRLVVNEGADVTNITRVSSSTFDPNMANNLSTVDIDIVASADVAITKTGPASVTAGTNLTYTLTATNAGPSAAAGVVVVDNLPPGATFVSAVPSAGTSFNHVNGVVTWNIGNILKCVTPDSPCVPIPTPPSLTITVAVAPDATGQLVNATSITSTTSDPNIGNNLASFTTAVTATAALTLTKPDSPDPAVAGKKLTYSLVVGNTGPSTAVNVVVRDTLPANTTLDKAVSGTGSTVCAELQPGIVSCDVGTLNPGETRTIFITVLIDSSVPEGTVITNNATATSPTSPDAIASANTTVTTQADLKITKDASFDSIMPSRVTYIVKVTNLGPSDAHNVVVVDTLPFDKSKVTFLSDTSNGGCTYDSATHKVTCDVGTLAAGEEWSVEMVVDCLSGWLVNTVTVSSSTFDPDTSNNTAVRSIRVKGRSSGFWSLFFW